MKRAKYLKMSKWARVLSLVIVSLLMNSCVWNPLTLGLKNPQHFKYSRSEIKQATILSIAAKLEKKYHTDQLSSDHMEETDDIQLNEKSKQIDFLRRIKENE